MSDVVIFVRGGVFQGAVSNAHKNRIMVVNYDDEEEDGPGKRVFTNIPKDRAVISRLVEECTTHRTINS
jgi:hypothetical protein